MKVIDHDKLPAAAVEAADKQWHETLTHAGRDDAWRAACAAFLDALLADDEVMRSLVERYQGVMIGFNDPRVRRMRAALTAAVQEER